MCLRVTLNVFIIGHVFSVDPVFKEELNLLLEISDFYSRCGGPRKIPILPSNVGKRSVKAGPTIWSRQDTNEKGK